MNDKKLRASFALLGLVASTIAQAAGPSTEVNIFSPPQESAAQAKSLAKRPIDLPARASLPVKVNLAQLRKVPLQAEVLLNLPDGRTMKVVHDANRQSESGSYTFVGYLRDHGTDHRVILTEAPNGSVNGLVNLPDGALRLEGRRGQSWLVDVKKAGLQYAPLAEPRLPKGLGERVAQKAAQLQRRAAPDVAASPEWASTVDLMIVYTPNMVSMYGGDGGARARIDYQMAVFNQILRDSGVEVTARLAKALFVNQDDNVNQGTLLDMITNAQGAFWNVRAERDSAGADVVHLLHKPTVGVGSCGLAYLSVTQGPTGHADWAYGVTDDNCPDMVMAHEVGHNFGMNHDHAQGGGDPVFPYAWGYLVPGTSYGDVMSYAGQYYYKYSNPRQYDCLGQACGYDGWADATRAINETRGIVEGYRYGAPPEACFYEHANYQGRYFCATGDSGWVGGDWNDMISSVKVPSGARVVLYEHSNFEGNAVEVQGDASFLSGFNDVASSFRILR